MNDKRKKKITLCRISTNFRDSKYKASFKTLAIGLHLIRAYCLTNPRVCESYDIEVKAFHLKTETGLIISELLADNPSMIGFSSYQVDYIKTIEVAESIKAIRPEIIIVAGGPQFFDAEEELRRHEFIDIAIPFEGELTFEELLISNIEGRGVGTVRGLAYRKDGVICFSGPREELLDINKIPTVNTDEYLSEITDSVICQLSRGCSHACGYCAYAYDKYRELPMSRVREELSRIFAKKDIVRIIFADLDLAYGVDRFNELLDFLIEHNDRKVVIDGFWCSLPKISGCLAKMREAGFRTEFDISLQSVSDHVLKKSNRKWLSLKQMKDIIPKILEHFPQASVELILGLPGETPESFRNDHLTLFRHGIRGFNVFELMVLPGSEFYKRREELGLVWHDNVSYQLKSNPDFSETQMKEAKDFSTNFQILAWILHPSDMHLYEKWGMDIIAIADRIETLKAHCSADYDMGIVAAHVSEDAIDALTEFLENDFGFDSVKTKIINEYLHFRFKLDRFEIDAVRELLEGENKGTEPPVGRFIKLEATPDILQFLDIKRIGEGEGSGDSRGIRTVHAIFNHTERKIVLTEGGDPVFYGGFLEIASTVRNYPGILSELNPETHSKALYIIVRLAETGAVDRTRFEEFVSTHRVLSSILKQADFELLRKWGVVLNNISSINDNPSTINVSESKAEMTSAERLADLILCEYSIHDDKVSLFKEYIKIKHSTHEFEKRIRTENVKKNDGLIDEYLKYIVSREVLEMLGISEKRVEIGEDGKAVVFAVYNRKYGMAIYLSGKNNTGLERVLNAAMKNNTLEKISETVGIADTETKRMIFRMQEAGFFSRKK